MRLATVHSSSERIEHTLSNFRVSAHNGLVVQETAKTSGPQRIDRRLLPSEVVLIMPIEFLNGGNRLLVKHLHQVARWGMRKAANCRPTVRRGHTLNDIVHRRVRRQRADTSEVHDVSEFLHNNWSRSLHRDVRTRSESRSNVSRSENHEVCPGRRLPTIDEHGINSRAQSNRSRRIRGEEPHNQIQNRWFKTLPEGRTLDAITTRSNGSRGRMSIGSRRNGHGSKVAQKKAKANNDVNRHADKEVTTG